MAILGISQLLAVVLPQGSKYGHLAYTETSGDLAQVTSVDGVTNTLAPDAAQAFENMVAAAKAQGSGYSSGVRLSICHRSADSMG